MIMVRGFPVDNKNIRAHSKRNPDCKRSPTNGIIYKLNTESDNFILSLDLVQTVFPVKNLSSQLTHQELTLKLNGGLILRTLSYLTVNSQDDSHCELALSFP